MALAALATCILIAVGLVADDVYRKLTIRRRGEQWRRTYCARGRRLTANR